MQHFLRLALLASAAAAGVAGAIYLAGPPGSAASPTREAPADLPPAASARAAAPSESQPSPAARLPLDTAGEAKPAAVRLTAAASELGGITNSHTSLELPVPAGQHTLAAPSTSRPNLVRAQDAEPLAAPLPDPRTLAAAPLPSTLDAVSGAASAPDPYGGVMNNLMQNPAALKQLIQGSGLENQTLGELLNGLPGQQNPAAPAPASSSPPAAPRPAPAEKAPDDQASPPADDAESLPPKTSISHVAGSGQGADHLVITIQNEDIRNVLEALSEQADLNILASTNVTGTVSAVLKDVDVQSALDAILKSTGFVARREGKFIYVGTPQDFEAMKLTLDTISTRVFRPNYVTAKDLQLLLTPLLTPGAGKISITAPAQIGIAANATDAGGDHYASNEALLVQDYEGVLLELEQVVKEIDKRPMQVAIEAMILSVNLSDEYKFGINFQALRDDQNVRLGVGTPRTAPLDGTGQTDSTTGGQIGAFSFTTGGLQFAFLDGSLGTFITALETIGDTNVIATPRILCLNKQKAEILIGAQYGYVNTTVTQTYSTQSVQFLEVGAQLRLRPFIANDGMIRMEIHPELSTGQVQVTNGFTLPQKELTQVTTNIMCRDGCTVVIGGLMREDLQQNTTQVPVLGSMPVIGPLFRSIDETVTRQEIVVLVTPRIVFDPDYAKESDATGHDFMRRQKVVEDHMTPFSRVDMSRYYVRKAQAAKKAGDDKKAARLLECAMRFDSQNLDAIQLRSDLEGKVPPPAVRARIAPPAPLSHPPAHPAAGIEHPVDGEAVAPWMLDDLQGKGSTPVIPIRPRSAGELVPPGPVEKAGGAR